MKYIAAFFCLVMAVAVANAASIAGEASIDKNSVSAGGRLVFPRIPGFNSPLSSIFGFRTTTARPTSNNTSSSNGSATSLKNNLLNLFDLPDPNSLIPADLSSAGNIPEVDVPLIPELPDLSQLPKIPGVSAAMQEARDHVAEALQLGTNFTAGIQQAIQDAFASNDPAAALRTVVQTIINSYLTVAANCPLITVGSRVLQEGIRLAIEVARSAGNVISGTTSAP